ncbi:MAG: BspA family leucine-rich repeat surface protein [Balneolaceae bacterium]
MSQIDFNKYQYLSVQFLILLLLFFSSPYTVTAQNDQKEPLKFTVNINAELTNGVYLGISNYLKYDLTVDWGDGTEKQFTYNEHPSHQYMSPGVYEVIVTGDLHQLYLYPGGFAGAITIKQWGEYKIESMSYAFRQVDTLIVDAADVPDLSHTTTLEGMFSSSSYYADISYLDVDVSEWDISNISNLAYMFAYSKIDNCSMEGWNTSSVTTVKGIFKGAKLFNCDLNKWDTKNVRDFSESFSGAESFNGNITDWNVSNGKNFKNMFREASLFNKDIGNWNISNGDFLFGMFAHAESFNQDIDNWNVSKVTNFSEMFLGASSFNQDLNKWDVTNVSTYSFSHMFEGATSFNGNISNWDVSNGYYFMAMFRNASSFNQDISSWNVSNAYSYGGLYYMFDGATSFDQNLGNWDVNSIKKFTNFLTGVQLSTANYDSLLVGWSKQDLSKGVSFNGGLSTASSVGDSAREEIVYKFNWTITDGDGIFVSNERSEKNQPISYNLSQNYPNPFNPTTTFQYQLPKNSIVEIKIFNTNGQLITLLVNEKQPAGIYTVGFDASNLSSGIYIYRIKTDNFTKSNKMVLIK